MERTYLPEQLKAAGGRSWLDKLVSVAVLIGACGVIWTTLLRPLLGEHSVGNRPGPVIPSKPVAIGEWVRGRPEAPIVLLEFSDFQCPFCQRFSTEVLPQLEKEFLSTGKVQLRFRHLPLEAIHPLALGLATAADCAGQQGQFWPMHDLLFSSPKPESLGRDALSAAAAGFRVDAVTFATCLDGAGSHRVTKDKDDAIALGLSSTPSFYIGTLLSGDAMKVMKVLKGTKPVAEFAAAFAETGLMTSGRKYSTK